jgi:YesN/AraC family two-component response regulator
MLEFIIIDKGLFVKNIETLKILYIDDSLMMRKKIETILSGRVAELYIAEDGKDGLKQYRKYSPDLVVSDINMPIMDGLEMSEIIKKIDSDQIIILLTSLDNMVTLKKAIKVGIDAFITKPVDDNELLSNLKSFAQIIQNRKDAKNIKKLQVQKEKLELVINLIKEISHHWRQPLSTISTIASSNLVKSEYGMIDLEEVTKDMDMISTNVQILGDLLQNIETIDIEKSNFKEIEDIIKISNPIYE